MNCDHGAELCAFVELHRYENGSWGALGFLPGRDQVPEIVVQCDDPRKALEAAGWELGIVAEREETA